MEIDTKKETERITVEIQGLQGQLSQLDQRRQEIVSHIVMRQGILAYFSQQNGVKPEQTGG